MKSRVFGWMDFPSLSLAFATLAALLLPAGLAEAADAPPRRLPVKEYRDKMKAGWIGQIAGVSWGAPTEFKWRDQIIPADKMPKWKPAMINDAFGQDDLYVEMTFLRTLEQYGLDVLDPPGGHRLRQQRLPALVRQRRRAQEPAQGHRPARLQPSAVQQVPQRHRLPDRGRLLRPDRAGPAAGGDRPGREVRPADELRRRRVRRPVHRRDVRRGLLRERPGQDRRGRPPGHSRARASTPRWSATCSPGTRQNPDDWEETWQKCQEKYRKNPEYQKASNGGIDCKINGAYVLMGLLYGERDLDQTIVIACRGGMDSDCNPSSSGGRALHHHRLQPSCRSGSTPAWTRQRRFSHTAYNFPALLDVCEKLARQVGRQVRRPGREGRRRRGGVRDPGRGAQAEPAGAELGARPDRRQPLHRGGDGQDHRAATPANMNRQVEKFAPGWKIANCGTEMDPGLRAEWAGKKNVLVTHPLDRDTGCVLSRTVIVPAGRQDLAAHRGGPRSPGRFRPDCASRRAPTPAQDGRPHHRRRPIG